MTKNLILNLRIQGRKENYDIEVSEEITAYELIYGLNEAYDLEIDVNDITKSFLRTENPISLLRGDKKLYEFGLHNGTIINVI